MKRGKLGCLLAGPTDKTKLFRFGGIARVNYQSYLSQMGLSLGKNLDWVDIIPDQGVPLDLARAYRAKGGYVIGHVPQGKCASLEPYFGECDKIEEHNGGWSSLNTCLSLKSDLVVVTGLSPGTFVEISYTKYHRLYLGRDIPVLVDTRAISSRLPLELEDELNVYYFDTESKLENLLKKIRKKNETLS